MTTYRAAEPDGRIPPSGQPVTARADGYRDAVTPPQARPGLQGRDADGYLVYLNRDGMDVRVSECCQASAKGTEDGICCRRCYALIDEAAGGQPVPPYQLGGRVTFAGLKARGWGEDPPGPPYALRGGVVVPDCGQPGYWHDPPGPAPAAYFYVYRCADTGLDERGMTLCAACCAKIRLLGVTGQPTAKGWYPPPPTRITVLRDANTLERVILIRAGGRGQRDDGFRQTGSQLPQRHPGTPGTSPPPAGTGDTEGT